MRTSAIVGSVLLGALCLLLIGHLPRKVHGGPFKVDLIDANDSVRIETIARAVCENKKGREQQISKLSTVRQLD